MWCYVVFRGVKWCGGYILYIYYTLCLYFHVKAVERYVFTILYLNSLLIRMFRKLYVAVFCADGG